MASSEAWLISAAISTACTFAIHAATSRGLSIGIRHLTRLHACRACELSFVLSVTAYFTSLWSARDGTGGQRRLVRRVSTDLATPPCLAGTNVAVRDYRQKRLVQTLVSRICKPDMTAAVLQTSPAWCMQPTGLLLSGAPAGCSHIDRCLLCSHGHHNNT